MEIKKDANEVEEIIDRALEELQSPSKKYSAEYILGVEATLDWLTGRREEDPISRK